jgi:hypothetical protein
LHLSSPFIDVAKIKNPRQSAGSFSHDIGALAHLYCGAIYLQITACGSHLNTNKLKIKQFFRKYLKKAKNAGT